MPSFVNVYMSLKLVFKSTTKHSPQAVAEEEHLPAGRRSSCCAFDWVRPSGSAC